MISFKNNYVDDKINLNFVQYDCKGQLHPLEKFFIYKIFNFVQIINGKGLCENNLKS